METASLLWNSLVLAGALGFAGVAFSAEVKCPAYQDKHPLVSVVLFDGPPAEKADLMPDASTGSGDNAVSSWEVGYIFASGRNLFLVCRFSGVEDSKNATIKVEKKVERCIFRVPRNPNRPSCRANKRSYSMRSSSAPGMASAIARLRHAAAKSNPILAFAILAHGTGYLLP